MRNQHVWEVENEDRFPYAGSQELLNFCLVLSWIWQRFVQGLLTVLQEL